MRARNAAQGGNSFSKRPPMEEWKLARIINDPNIIRFISFAASFSNMKIFF